MTILAFEGIEKAYAAKVLRGVSFTVGKGTAHALLGENGAGKSTLMKILLGVEQPDGGKMVLDGAPYAPRTPLDARRAGVVMVPQERTLCAHLTVEENIVLGFEPRRGSLVLDRGASREIAMKALELVVGSSRRISPSTRALDLSVADQQTVEIARALAVEKTKVIVLDEPTASLGHEDAERLLQRVDALREAGLAIVLVTHFLAHVRAHTDRYTVLRDGKVQGEGDPKSTPAETIVHQILGKELEAAREATKEASEGEVLLEVKELSGVKKPAKASFTLRRGEVLGIAGLVGSGRTELLRVVLGLDARTKGEVKLNAPKGIGMLSEDRGGEGLMLRRSIAENVTLSKDAPVVELPRRVNAQGAKWIAELSIRATGPEQPAFELSGGNQQKVQIARLLREDYDVLLVDEPTRGIDVASKAQVLSLLRGLAAKGKGVVLVSSQLDELLSTCDRIAVLSKGVLREPQPASGWNEERLMLEAAS